MRNDLPPAYWMLAAQFLRLAHESCVEIINSGNKYTLVSDVPISPLEFSHAVRWSDHAVGAGVLFSYFHGIELILKGFLSAQAPKGHPGIVLGMLAPWRIPCTHHF